MSEDSMQDTVFIEGLEARAIIGIHEWEREKPQTIRFDLEMACDASQAAADEDIEKTINYRSVAKAILAHVEENPYYLVETLAHRLAEMIMKDHGVPWIRLRVSKPGAVRFSENVGIEVVRGSRSSGR
jgi:dihydroneopterin aldolase